MGHRRVAVPAVAVPAVSLVLLLYGCVSGLRSTAPPVQAYVLEPPVQASRAGGVPGAGPGVSASVRVLAPLAAPGLGTDGIAVLRPGARLDAYRGVRWAGTVPAMVQALMIDALRSRRRFALVEPDGGPFATGYELSLEVRDFEAVYGAQGPPTVRVALVGTLGRPDRGEVIASFTAESRVRASANRMRAVVAAFQSATDRAVSQLAAQLQPPAGRPAAPADP